MGNRLTSSNGVDADAHGKRDVADRGREASESYIDNGGFSLSPQSSRQDISIRSNHRYKNVFKKLKTVKTFLKIAQTF